MSPVDPLAQTGGARAPEPTRSARPAGSPATSFADVHAAAKAKAKAAGHPLPKDAAPQVWSEDEKWKPVPGRPDQAEITEGPRAGKFINLSGNSRHGQLFVKEERDGKVFHVYGEGDKKISVAAGAAPAKPQRAKPPEGETWAPVQNHPGYADILNGPRNGFFVNISGNKRDGQEFLIVRRGGAELHAYGDGPSRNEVWIRPVRKKDD